MSASRFTRKTAPRDWLDVDKWATPKTDNWTDSEKLRFNLYRDAITDYVRGGSVSQFLSDNNTSWESFLRAFNRCLARDRRGRPIGWHGLVPFARVHKPIRTKPLKQSGRNNRGGLSGAMQLFLSANPALKRDFDLYLLENAKRMLGSEGRLRPKSAHQYFIKLCETAKHSPSEWPLNAASRGRGAVSNYINAFIHARYDDIVSTQFGQKAGAKANTGRGIPSRITASRNYDVVELDEHSAHFAGSIGIPTADGVRWMELGRLTIIAAADRKGDVLGGKVICRREADAEDILDAFEASFGGLPPHKYSNDAYDKLKGAFPASLGAPFTACAFNQLLLDGALSHIARPVVTRARKIGGFDINYGPVARFERRPVIEGIFSAIERLGFHRLRQTTGTGPQDPRRQHAEKAAVEARMHMDELIDLVVAVLADANSRQGKPNFGRSHLDQLRDLRDDVDGFGMIFPVLPPLPIGVPPLSVSVVPLTVRGNKEKGRRPAVYFEEETYFGTELADRWDLLDKEVVAHVRRADIRTLELVTTKGEVIDTVTVAGRWSRSAHSLDLRRHINWMIRQGYLKVRYDEDPVHVHQEDVKKRASQTRGAKGKVTKAVIAAHAEDTRVSAAAASEISERELERALAGARSQLPELPVPRTSSRHDDWQLDDLGSLNGGM